MNEVVTNEPLLPKNAEDPSLLEEHDTIPDDISIVLLQSPKFLRFLYKLLSIIGKICFFFIAQGGFGLYTFVSFCLTLSPFYSFISSIGDMNWLTLISSILQIIVGYPLFEIVTIFPVGIYKQLWSSKEGIYPISPLHWTIKGLDYGLVQARTRPFITFLVFLLAVIVDTSLTIMLIIYFSSANIITCYIMIGFIVIPFIYGIYSMLRIIIKCWIYVFFPNSEFCKNETKEEADDKKERGWPFIHLWEKYLDDTVSDPINAIKEKTKERNCYIIFIALYAVLIILHVTQLAMNFQGIYLGALFMNLLLFPFYIRFNYFKKYVGKEKFENHERFRKVSNGLTIAYTVIIVIFTYWLISLLTHLPPVPPSFTGTEFADDDPSHQFKWGMPSECEISFMGLTTIQWLGLAELPLDIIHGGNALESKLELVLGENWSSNYHLIKVVDQERLDFVHFELKEQDAEVISIKTTAKFADYMLNFEFSQLYTLPQTIFNIIPMSNILYSQLLDVIMDIIMVPVSLFNPAPLRDKYLNPLVDYVKQFNRDKRLVIIGHGTGGVLAKLISQGYGFPAMVFNAPPSKVSLLPSNGEVPIVSSKIHNVLSQGEKYVGSEDGGIVIKIAFDRLPTNPSTSSMLLCALAVQCGKLMRYQDYCEKTITPAMLKALNQSSRYR